VSKSHWAHNVNHLSKYTALLLKTSVAPFGRVQKTAEYNIASGS